MSTNIRPLSETEITSLKERNVWAEDCPVHYSRLRMVRIPFLDFEGESQIGEIVILDSISEKVEALFKELFEIQFNIEKVNLIDRFSGNDVESMRANNSSGFNGRKIVNTNRWSSHAFGVAIDINPIQNPYLKLGEEGIITAIPKEGINYVNRNVPRKGMVEPIVSVFAKYGFTEWGGNWELKPDYHHFQLPWEEIQKIDSSSNPESGLG